MGGGRLVEILIQSERNKPRPGGRGNMKEVAPMGLDKLIALAMDNPGWTAVWIGAASLLTVKKLELPVWGWLRAWGQARLDGLGKLLNAAIAEQLGKIMEAQATMAKQIKALEDGQKAQQARADQDKAERHREQILRFNLELINGMRHDREQYVEILDVIDWYREYCRTHEKFPNGRADAAMRNITLHYDAAMKAGFPLRGIDFIKEVNE